MKSLTKPDQLSEYFAIGCFEKFLEVCFNQALGQAVVSFGERPNATLNPVDKWPTIPVSQTKQRLGAHGARLGFVQCVVDQSLCVLRATDAKVSAEKPPSDCLGFAVAAGQEIRHTRQSLED